MKPPSRPSHRSRASGLILALPVVLSACSLVEEPPPEPLKPVRIDSSPEAEARAAFVQLMVVSRHQTIREFKRGILASDLPDFEREESDHPGRYSRLMAGLARARPRDYELSLNDQVACFKRDETRSHGDPAISPETERVTLVRADHQWKLAKNP